MLFTGDHVMQGSTVVINPPDGDMRAYLQSLERLLGEDIAIIAPGHGYLIGAPHREVQPADRAPPQRARRKVLAALERLEHPSLEEMLPLVYDDVPERIHRGRGALAHRAPRQARRRRRGAPRGEPLYAGKITGLANMATEAAPMSD